MMHYSVACKVTEQTKALNNEVQAQENVSRKETVPAVQEQPVLTQQKIMDLILMQQQAQDNSTSGHLRASTWATKKQGFTDMLSGFRSPNGTTYRVTLDLASVIFVSVAAADADRMIFIMAHSQLGTTKNSRASGTTPRSA
jgi:hypothetical protein